MNFRNSSKAALGAARVALLAGAGAAALGFGFASPAYAQTTTIDSSAVGVNEPGYGITTIKAGGTQAAGVQQGALYTQDTAAGTVTYISGGTLTSNDPSNRTLLDPTGVTVKDSSGNVAVLQTNGVGVIGANGNVSGIDTLGISTGTGPGGTQTFGVNAGNGNMFATGTATFGNTLTVASGGANITGGTTTDTLTVTNGAIGTTITPSGIDTGSINVGGTLTANTVNSNAVYSTVVGADQVNTVGLNADAANFGVSGNTAIDGKGNVTIGTANKNANLTVSGTATVTGQAYLNGGATVSNNLTVSGAGNGGSATNVDMGGNVVHDVAAPVLGTDAANKAYVDAGLNAANQRIDRANQGVAIAMAVQNPVLTGSDRFGVAVNFSDFAGNSAVGATAVGILAQNVFGGGEKFGLTGGFGTSSNQTAGRVGVQLTW